jgi:NAD+ synthase
MEDKIIERIVQWLKEQLNKSHAKGFILGLSGGLDSAVCGALIKKAIDNCLGLILPIASDVKDLDDASEVASTINLETQYIDLTSIYNNLIKFLPDNNKVALGNVKARLRMVVLYYYANYNNYLVCGTGNKTEIALGYFTKHGDGACDILPLGDLYKSEVKKLAGVLGIPDSIIKKIPSAGLWKGQTDEEEIGFSYDEIDKTLQAIEKGQIKDDIAKKLQFMMEHSEHKRRLPKICFLKNSEIAASR